MDIRGLLQAGRTIWGDDRLSLNDILIRLGVDYGDLCRYERNADKDAESHTDEALKKQLGNVIFSLIRWCDDLGFDPEDCIRLAQESQRKFVEQNAKR